MNKTIILILISTILLCSSIELKAEVTEQDCNQKEKMSLITHDIFNLQDPDTIFLHRWANFFHIKTKNKTVFNEAAFFTKKCEIDLEDLKELERHLRSQKYIKDSRVSYKEQLDIVEIETWDNWSLMPTIDFGRKGGKNKYAIGIKDRNFLGLGIDAELESFTNDQRSGYKFSSHFPLFLSNNIDASIRFTSNDDGKSEAVFINKKFVSFDTQNAFHIGFNNFEQIDTQYKNGDVFSQYGHKQKLSTATWNWLKKDSANDTLRFGVGFTSEEHNFINTSNTPPLVNVYIPKDREFNYPFFNVEFLQKDYRKLTNLNLINHIEDFNFGWHVSSKLGTGLGSNSPSIIWQSSVAKGIDIFKNNYWFVTASLEGETYNSSNNESRTLLSISNEYFHKINSKWGGYLKNVSKFSKGQFKDSPVVLGGETGLRGYPLQYQHGNNSTLFTMEARYYPQINLYKLLEVGGAAFIDTGKVFGQTQYAQSQSSWMTSVGLGARFYSTQTSEARVIHVDIVKPMSSDANVNGIEFRITTKHSF